MRGIKTLFFFAVLFGLFANFINAQSIINARSSTPVRAPKSGAVSQRPESNDHSSNQPINTKEDAIIIAEGTGATKDAAATAALRNAIAEVYGVFI